MKKTLFLLIIIAMLASCDLFKGYQILSEMKAEPELPKSHTDNVIMPINDYFAPDADNTWTFMIVLNGDNNLEAASIKDFNEMELGLYKGLLRNPDLTKYLNVIVLFDRGTYPGRGGVPGWDETRVYKILPDSNMSSIQSEDKTNQYIIETSSAVEQNLGDPGVFTTFIDYCTAHYTSDHYAFIVWNHGSGPDIRIAKSLNSYTTPIRGPNYSISMDDDDGSEYPLKDEITMKELQTALDTTVIKKFDLMGFDACLMGSVETAYQFKNQVDYLVVSMDEEGEDGWNYETLFENMGLATDSTYSDSKTLSKVLVQNYYDTYKNDLHSDQYATMTAVDLSKINAFKTKVDNLAYHLSASSNRNAMIPIRWASNAYTDVDIGYLVSGIGLYVDLYDFCINIETNYGKESPLGQAAREVIEEFSQCIVAAYGHEDYGHYIGLGEFVKRGLYIVYPNEDRGLQNLSFTNWYNNTELDFCTTNGTTIDTWTELLQEWFESSLW